MRRALWAGAVAVLVTVVTSGAAGADTRIAHGTQMSAEPAIAEVLAPDTGVFLTFTAQLEDISTGATFHAPVPILGAVVRMVVNGNTVCSATTDAGGIATCGALQDAVGTLTSGYTAVFDGEEETVGITPNATTTVYFPSSARAPSLRVLGASVPAP